MRLPRWNSAFQMCLRYLNVYVFFAETYLKSVLQRSFCDRHGMDWYGIHTQNICNVLDSAGARSLSPPSWQGSGDFLFGICDSRPFLSIFLIFPVAHDRYSGSRGFTPFLFLHILSKWICHTYMSISDLEIRGCESM